MIRIVNCGTYWRVTFDGIETSTYARAPNGFWAEDELRAWLERMD